MSDKINETLTGIIVLRQSTGLIPDKIEVLDKNSRFSVFDRFFKKKYSGFRIWMYFSSKLNRNILKTYFYEGRGIEK